MEAWTRGKEGGMEGKKDGRDKKGNIMKEGRIEKEEDDGNKKWRNGRIKRRKEGRKNEKWKLRKTKETRMIKERKEAMDIRKRDRKEKK